jgi:hypothetical protein
VVQLSVHPRSTDTCVLLTCLVLSGPQGFAERSAVRQDPPEPEFRAAAPRPASPPPPPPPGRPKSQQQAPVVASVALNVLPAAQAAQKEVNAAPKDKKVSIDDIKSPRWGEPPPTPRPPTSLCSPGGILAMSGCLVIVALILAGNILYTYFNTAVLVIPGQYSAFTSIPFTFNTSQTMNSGKPVTVVLDWKSATTALAGMSLTAELTLQYPSTMLSTSAAATQQSGFRQIAGMSVNYVIQNTAFTIASGASLASCVFCSLCSFTHVYSLMVTMCRER